jgi:hypothetical protein
MKKTFTLAANGRNVFAFNGKAVAEYRDDEVERSLQNDPVSWF